MKKVYEELVLERYRGTVTVIGMRSEKSTHRNNEVLVIINEPFGVEPLTLTLGTNEAFSLIHAIKTAADVAMYSTEEQE